MRRALHQHLVALPLTLLVMFGLGAGPAFVSVIDALTESHEHRCHCPLSEHHCSCPLCGGLSPRVRETPEEGGLSQAPCGEPRVKPHLAMVTVLLFEPAELPKPKPREEAEQAFPGPSRLCPGAADGPEPPPPKTVRC
jgi:hypothetical protein